MANLGLITTPLGANRHHAVRAQTITRGPAQEEGHQVFRCPSGSLEAEAVGISSTRTARANDGTPTGMTKLGWRQPDNTTVPSERLRLWTAQLAPRQSGKASTRLVGIVRQIIHGRKGRLIFGRHPAREAPFGSQGDIVNPASPSLVRRQKQFGLRDRGRIVTVSLCG
jgi:hypothetical protein